MNLAELKKKLAALQAEGAEVEFRRIQLTPLPSAD